MRRITVLGCGLVGAAIARDLSRETDFEITVADASEQALARLRKQTPVRTRSADLSRPGEIAAVAREADAVVGALPGHLGFDMSKWSSGRESLAGMFSPSFSLEDLLSLEAPALEKEVMAVVDCCVSPLISSSPPVAPPLFSIEFRRSRFSSKVCRGSAPALRLCHPDEIEGRTPGQVAQGLTCA